MKKGMDPSLRWDDNKKSGNDKTRVGILFVVATPIGNLEDITLRAIRVLREVDLVACEDTRVTGKLLAHFDIRKPMISYFQHSKLAKVELIIEKLLNGENIALVTDAGTPGISDPGQELVTQIRQSVIARSQSDEAIYQKRLPRLDSGHKSMARNDNLIKIIPIPGPSALAAAASVSGLIEKEFYFAGFLPKKKGRQTKFNALKMLDCPIVIYENAMRLEKTLGDIREYWGDNTEVFIAREMTKMFEEYWGGPVGNVLGDLKNHQMKGEIVLIIKKLK